MKSIDKLKLKSFKGNQTRLVSSVATSRQVGQQINNLTEMESEFGQRWPTIKFGTFQQFSIVGMQFHKPFFVQNKKINTDKHLWTQTSASADFSGTLSNNTRSNTEQWSARWKCLPVWSSGCERQTSVGRIPAYRTGFKGKRVKSWFSIFVRRFGQQILTPKIKKPK